jgi:hypothetical protein
LSHFSWRATEEQVIKRHKLKWKMAIKKSYLASMAFKVVNIWGSMAATLFT